MSLPPLVEPAPTLSTAEIERYSRHAVLPGIGLEGQRRLKNARVLVVGAGGLGSPVLLYLAAAGVGTIGIVDRTSSSPRTCSARSSTGSWTWAAARSRAPARPC